MISIKFSTIIILLLSNILIHAQTNEIKGIKNTYIQKEVTGLYIVHNKSNSLMHITPSYLLYEHTPPVTVGNKSELDKIVKNYLSSYFKKYTGEFKLSSALSISFFSNISGIIKEIQIAYPKEVGVIPATVIEDFEKAVLQSNVKLEFDNNLREFKGTAWVGQYAIYNPDKLRKCE